MLVFNLRGGGDCGVKQKVFQTDPPALKDTDKVC